MVARRNSMTGGGGRRKRKWPNDSIKTEVAFFVSGNRNEEFSFRTEIAVRGRAISCRNSGRRNRNRVLG